MQNQLKISIGQYSDKGRKETNQDFHDIHIPKEPQLTTKGIAIALADGISSSDVSQIASKTSVTSFLLDYFSTPESWSVKKSAERVVNSVNSWLYSQSKEGQYHYDKDRGYVCTFSAMVIKSTTAHIFHAGDTRIYRLREKKLEQLTEDHRLWVSREKSYLSRALGMDSLVTTDYESFQVEKEDLFLFMTDGIYEFVSADSMIYIIEQNGNDFDAMAKAIAEKAYDAGSDDNLTVQIVRVDTLPNKDVDEIHKQLTEKPFAPILDARMKFDGYTIVRELSASSRSHVYLAVDDETNTSVVLKTPSIDLQDDKAFLERFLMEEWIAIRINSAHVAKSYLQTRKRNYLYNVTEFIEGQTLTQWMIDNPAPSLEMVREMTEQIARGIQAFHRQEMVHQDLRPENILIDTTGTVKIIDFGSTRVEGIVDINTRLEQENLLGTALYSAPEYFLGKVGTPGSDIFSLAIIIYQMLSGKFPYGVQLARCTTKAAQKKLKYASLYSDDGNIPIWIDETLRKALQPDPNDRYEELSEFIYDLRHPNQKYVNKTRPPLYERNPVVIWKSISFVLAVVIVVLLSN
ncbi:MAG: bifunctional protein-serine/threonine kinase/phosphatase [Helicobacteraceae bacterium]|jgi:serine/threonine protein phosphatase PrpC|nr:bifunctional protein-serine/threonine kinase/phosphatase [Helicobacteraceae bacterium]